MPKKFKSKNQFLVTINKEYKDTFKNLLGSDERAGMFLSNVKASIVKNPKLLQCDAETVLNSFLTMAQFDLMPSHVSGEAYVLPYKNKGQLEAQFQLGYKGLVTLFYRAGIKKITGEVVHKKDDFELVNGDISHHYDPFNNDRGEEIGAYIIVMLPSGEEVSKAMSKEEIEKIGKDFSKGYNSKYSPWKKENDPQRWMWKKTVLKQIAKLIPSNETISQAINEDNKSTVIHDMETSEGKNGDSRKDKIEDVNVESIVERMNKAKDADELKEIWGGLNHYAQGNKEVIKAKEELKEKFEKEEEDNKSKGKKKDSKKKKEDTTSDDKEKEK